MRGFELENGGIDWYSSSYEAKFWPEGLSQRRFDEGAIVLLWRLERPRNQWCCKNPQSSCTACSRTAGCDHSFSRRSILTGGNSESCVMQDGAAASVTPVWALSQATVRDQILIRLLQLTSQRLSLHSG